MYSVCYVLIDNTMLRYYNELLISLSSLRQKGFRGSVRILTDEKTAKEIEKQNSQELMELSAELVVIDIPDKYSQKERSRFIKTSMREYVKGDFLFLDTDTIIADKLPVVVSDHDIAMVRDMHGTMLECGKVDFYRNLFEKCHYSFDASARMFNSGVIWCKDTAFSHYFFKRWHDEWIYTQSCGVVRDQVSLCKLSDEFVGVIAEIDDRFNVQVARLISLKHLIHAVVIHYFNDYNHSESCYALQQPEIQTEVFHSEIIQNIIESPREAFAPCRLVKLNGTEDQLAKTATYRCLHWGYTRQNKVFHVIESLARIIVKMRRVLIK